MQVSPISTVPFLNTNIFNWRVSQFENWFCLIQLFLFVLSVVEIADLVWVCQCENVDGQIVENRIEIDRSEAEKYEIIRESWIVFIIVFPT